MPTIAETLGIGPAPSWLPPVGQTAAADYTTADGDVRTLFLVRADADEYGAGMVWCARLSPSSKELTFPKIAHEQVVARMLGIMGCADPGALVWSYRPDTGALLEQLFAPSPAAED